MKRNYVLEGVDSCDSICKLGENLMLSCHCVTQLEK